MKVVFYLIVLIIVLIGAGLLTWRQLDHHADRAEIDRLRALQPKMPGRFNHTMVSGLPEPAQRYFKYTILEGTPLYTVADIEIQGAFSLGRKDAPNYIEMKARQVLAAPDGFIWKMSGGSGTMKISGSDAGRWTRFWMVDLLPVARFGGEQNHARSAFGRYVAEAAFWTPAAILPGPNVTWEAVDQDTARYTVTHEGIAQTVDVTVDEVGRPVIVQFDRWSNANSDNVYRLQVFGGFLSDYREFQGFRLPAHVEAGNFFGTDQYFPFFIANVTALNFPVL